jgi:flagellar motor switch protein FliN/FliY
MTIHQPPAPNHLASRFGDVAVRLSVELGRTELPLRDVLMLGEGSTVTLDRLTDELLDVTANGRVIARGEVVADKGRFALRIVCLVGEDGKDVPPLADPSFPAVPVADSAPDVPASAPAPAAPEPAAAAAPPPPPVDPLTSMLDDLT